MSDQGSNLFTIDLRNGGILYSYKGGVPRHNTTANLSFSTQVYLAR